MDGVDTALQRSEMRQRIPRFETSNKFYKFSIAHKSVRWNFNFQNVTGKKISGFFCTLS